MTIRPMRAEDAPAAHAIRRSDPSKITEPDHHAFMARDTMSRVREVDGTNAGFAMVNVERQNHWAPSVAPGHEREGFGGDLHDAMPERFFRRLDAPRSNTGPATRAELFHPQAGRRGGKVRTRQCDHGIASVMCPGCTRTLPPHTPHMLRPILPSALFILAFAACGGTDGPAADATGAADSTAAPAPVPIQSLGPNSPPTANTLVTDPNPPHGEPGHRCEIPVGASLATAPPAATSPMINAAPQAPGPVASPAATPPGMNPPHGQPGHVCEVPVGSPLPK